MQIITLSAPDLEFKALILRLFFLAGPPPRYSLLNLPQELASLIQSISRFAPSFLHSLRSPGAQARRLLRLP